jgi:hypothetical protein
VLPSAAALLNGLFEHPAEEFFSYPNMQTIEVLLWQNNFSATC